MPGDRGIPVWLCYVANVLRILPSGVGPVAGRSHPLARPLVLLVVLVSLVLAGTVPAGAQSGGDARAERERVRSQKAATASEVDALQASDVEVEAALAALEENVRGQQAAYADTERAAEQAEQEAAAARAAETAKQQEIEQLRIQVSELAVKSYVNPPTQEFLDLYTAESAGEAVRKQQMLDMRAGHDRDLLDQLRGAEQQLGEIREQAEDASEVAAERRDAARAELAELEGARAQQAEFATQVQQRLDSKLYEAAMLEATDASLSQQIATEEAAVADRLRRMADQAQSSGGGGGGGGPPIPVPGSIPLANVRGIVVHASIASQLESMLAAAAADGIILGGTGYRDISRQIELRRQNCGSSHYAIYEMSPEQCSPPTARPGASNHERGLAIDFTWNGSAINSRSSPAFQWLAANAGRFGFRNLPSEPWHWSTTGG